MVLAADAEWRCASWRPRLAVWVFGRKWLGSDDECGFLFAEWRGRVFLLLIWEG